MVRGIVALLLLGLTGCANYTIPKDDLVQQLRDNQTKNKEYSSLLMMFGAVGGAATVLLDQTYDSNGIKRVACLNAKGEKVYLFPDRNTQLEVTTKSTKDVVKMYFDTVFLVGNQVTGFRSRLLHSVTNQSVVEVEDIEKVEIYAEFPRTEPVKSP